MTTVDDAERRRTDRQRAIADRSIPMGVPAVPTLVFGPMRDRFIMAAIGLYALAIVVMGFTQGSVDRVFTLRLGVIVPLAVVAALLAAKASRELALDLVPAVSGATARRPFCSCRCSSGWAA